METNFTQQEIMLNVDAGFLAKDLCLKNDTGKPDTRTEKEKIEEACWNGLLRDMMPDIFVRTDDNKDLTLWKVRQVDAVLELELANCPSVVDKYFSIHPTSFLTVQEEN
jgi:hypothetical protein